MKELLVNATDIALPIPGAKFHVLVDASNIDIGSAFHQNHDVQLVPVGFFSENLAASRKALFYLLACYLLVKNFQIFPEGHHIIVLTDHEPLISATQRQSSQYTDRETRQLNYLSQFDLECHHILEILKVCFNYIPKFNFVSLQIRRTKNHIHSI